MSVEGCVAFFTVGVIYLYSNALVALFITTIISLIQLCFVLLCPESPKFLYSANRKKEANDSLKYIAKINSAKFKEIEIDEDVNNSNSANKNSSISLLEALKDRLYRKNILVMASVYCVSFMSYYVVGYYVGSFPGNLFINAFAVMTSDIIGSGLCSIWISFFGFKHGFSSLYIIVCISTIVYSFSNHELIISYICVFMIRFGLTMAGSTISIHMFSTICYKASSKIVCILKFLRKSYFNSVSVNSNSYKESSLNSYDIFFCSNDGCSALRKAKIEKYYRRHILMKIKISA